MKKTNLERVIPENVGISSWQIMNMVKELEDSGTELHGLMISRYNKVVFETWWAPYAPELPHSAHSLGKTYTGTAVGLAYTEGLVALDEKVVDIFSEEIEKNQIVVDENMKKMKVHHLLCFSTGMDHCPALSGEDFVINFLKAPVAYEPGEHFFTIRQRHAWQVQSWKNVRGCQWKTICGRSCLRR